MDFFKVCGGDYLGQPMKTIAIDHKNATGHLWIACGNLKNYIFQKFTEAFFKRHFSIYTSLKKNKKAKENNVNSN